MLVRERFMQYAYLMRLHKPQNGILLLLWPALWALWLASCGHPENKILMIFILGVVVMRSVGCVVNDIADSHFDRFVLRTQSRPLASNKITVIEAILLAILLSSFAFLLVLQCNALTIGLAFVGAILAFIYPFLKRVTHLPQLGLGLAFSWSVPMAFAAVTNSLDTSTWCLFFTCMIWPVIYDTMYAMTDKDDDVKIGVKSSAILFSDMDKLIIGLLQTLFVVMLVVIGLMFDLHNIYYACISLAAILFIYQQWLIKDRDKQKCFDAFLNNNWVGFIIFSGIYLSF